MNKQSEQHNQRGNDAFKSNDFERAHKAYTKAIESTSDSAPVAKYFTNRARTSLKLKLPDLAFDDADASLKLDPRNPKALYSKGESLLVRKDYANAKKEFEAAAEVENSDHIRTMIDKCMALEAAKIMNDEESTTFFRAKTDKELEELIRKRMNGMPLTSEENKNELFDEKEMRKYGEMVKKTTPIVMEAHIYRDAMFGKERDYVKALELYGKAAKLGNTEALYNRALMYADGRGTPVDLKMSIKLLKEAAAHPLFTPGPERAPRLGVALAHHVLGNYYREGHGTERDFNKAFEHYKIAAEGGELLSLSNLGTMYLAGEGTEVDVTKAMEVYTKAAEGGWAIAQYNLGEIYLNGRPGVEKNLSLAKSWFSKAAKLGDTEAALALANMDNLSLKSLQEAAKMGDPYAMFQLGCAYEEAIDAIEPNYELALVWFEKAAMKQYPDAQFRLGRLYLEKIPTGMEPNRISKGMQWIRTAAQLSHPQAQLTLSNAYRYGDYGLEKDSSLAQVWLDRAKKDPTIKNSIEFREEMEQKAHEMKARQGGEDISVDPQAAHLAKELASALIKDAALPKPRPNSTSNRNVDSPYSLENLQKYKHIPVVQTMILAKEHHARGTDLILEYEEPDSTIVERFIHEWFMAKTLCDYVCSYSSDLKPKILRLVEKFAFDHPTNCEAKYILALLYSSSNRPYPVMIKLLDDCVAMRPNESAYHILLGCMKCFAQEYTSAIKDFSAALRVCDASERYGILYHRATARRLSEEYVTSLEDYEEFLRLAPQEERKVPEALYGMAQCHQLRMEFEDMKMFFERGVEAEKNMLPLHPPVDLPQKGRMETFIKFLALKNSPLKPKPAERQAQNNICAVCEKPGTKFCGVCKGTWYCSREHKKRDWKAHKKVCDVGQINSENRKDEVV